VQYSIVTSDFTRASFIFLTLCARNDAVELRCHIKSFVRCLGRPPLISKSAVITITPSVDTRGAVAQLRRKLSESA
jgi:hypothetical protein